MGERWSSHAGLPRSVAAAALTNPIIRVAEQNVSDVHTVLQARRRLSSRSSGLRVQRPAAAVASARWSAIAVFGRQASQIVSALVLARVLGPETYGVISAATVYVTLTTLVLDQGLAAALVQRPVISRSLPGAVATANLLTAAGCSPCSRCRRARRSPISSHARTLTELLQVLGPGS